MDWNEVVTWAGTAVMLAAYFMFPRWFSFRQRAIGGTILFFLGWAGILGRIALRNLSFMQSEAMSFASIGISALAITIATTLLVPVFFEWWRKRRKPRRTKEKWSAGHLKD